jgi:AcrR family transcriptional regulator
MTQRRARSPETKEARKAAILAAARLLVDRTGFPSLTMDAVAARSGLAKGTLYNYFTTREELLLAILQADFAAWFSRLEAHWTRAEHAFDGDFVELWTAGVVSQPRLAAGMAYLHLLLEPNISEEFALSWKRFLYEKTTSLHYLLLSRFSPRLELAELVEAFSLFTGLSVGLWMQSQAPKQILAVYKSDTRLSVFATNFPSRFRLSANAMLHSPEMQRLVELQASSRS